MNQVERLHNAIDYYHDKNISTFPVQINFINGKKVWADGDIKWKDGFTKDQAHEYVNESKNCLAALTGSKYNLFVLDVDDKDYEEKLAFNAWLEKYDIDLTGIPQVRTWSGGSHFLFNFPEVLKDFRTTRAGVGLPFIDVRGDGGLEFIPPSNIDGQEYKWIKRLNGSLPDIPLNLLNVLLSDLSASKKTEAIPKGAEGDYTLVSNAVEFLSGKINSYDEWYRCGMALAEMGRDGFDHWITLSDSHEYNDPVDYLEYKFDNFIKERKEITIATLFEIAKKYGFTVPGKVVLSHGITGDNVKDSMDDAFFNSSTLMKALEYQANLSEEESFSLGWDETDLYIKIIKGQVTVITGYPYSGKSNFADDVMVNLNKRYGWKFSVFSPESQPIGEHLDSLISKYYQMPVRSGPIPNIPKEKYVEAIKWVKDNLFIMNASRVERHIDNILSLTLQEKEAHGVDALLIDPYNELEHNRPGKMSETEYVGFFLSKVLAFALREDIHVFIVAHPTKVFPEKGTKPPIVTPYNIAGSANWFNKASNIISVYRDLRSTEDTDKTTIHVQKVKRRRLGRIGQIDLRYVMATGSYKYYHDNEEPEKDDDMPF